MRVVYVRKGAPERLWLAVGAVDDAGAAGFDGGMEVWVDLAADGSVTTGRGTPSWWAGDIAC